MFSNREYTIGVVVLSIQIIIILVYILSFFICNYFKEDDFKIDYFKDNYNSKKFLNNDIIYKFHKKCLERCNYFGDNGTLGLIYEHLLSINTILNDYNCTFVLSIFKQTIYLINLRFSGKEYFVKEYYKLEEKTDSILEFIKNEEAIYEIFEALKPKTGEKEEEIKQNNRDMIDFLFHIIIGNYYTKIKQDDEDMIDFYANIGISNVISNYYTENKQDDKDMNLFILNIGISNYHPKKVIVFRHKDLEVNYTNKIKSKKI